MGKIVAEIKVSREHYNKQYFIKVNGIKYYEFRAKSPLKFLLVALLCSSNKFKFDLYNYFDGTTLSNRMLY